MLCSVRVARPKQRTLGGEVDGQLREGQQLQAAGGIGGCGQLSATDQA